MEKELPDLKLFLNDKEITVPFLQARQATWGLIPDWMKSSSIDPPEPTQEKPMVQLAPGMLKVARSAIKNLARPILPTMYKALYGQELHLGRQDSMPVLVQVLVDFMVLQAANNPIALDVNEDGYIEKVRSGKRDIQTNNATINRVEEPA